MKQPTRIAAAGALAVAAITLGTGVSHAAPSATYEAGPDSITVKVTGLDIKFKGPSCYVKADPVDPGQPEGSQGVQQTSTGKITITMGNLKPGAYYVYVLCRKGGGDIVLKEGNLDDKKTRVVAPSPQVTVGSQSEDTGKVVHKGGVGTITSTITGLAPETTFCRTQADPADGRNWADGKRSDYKAVAAGSGTSTVTITGLKAGSYFVFTECLSSTEPADESVPERPWTFRDGNRGNIDGAWRAVAPSPKVTVTAAPNIFGSLGR